MRKLWKKSRNNTGKPVVLQMSETEKRTALAEERTKLARIRTRYVIAGFILKVILFALAIWAVYKEI